MSKFQSKLVLASRSPRRAQLLENSGISFDVRTPDSHEDPPQESDSTWEYAIKTATTKATQVLSSISEGTRGSVFLLGADTIVTIEEEILGKPSSTEEALQILQKLSGKTHEVITGWVLIRGQDGASIDGFSRTQVTFAESSVDLLKSYIATGEPMDKAGAYGIQGSGSLLISEIKGSYSNVVGLPVAEVLRALSNFADIRPWGVSAL